MSLYREVDSSLALVTWIKAKLGYPTINIEISDQTILDNIGDAIQLYNKFSGDAKYRNALLINLVSGTDMYSLSGNSVDSVIDFETTFSLTGAITTLFTVENTLYNEGLLSVHAPMNLVSWEMVQEYIKLLKDKLVANFFIDYNKYTKILKVTPMPTKNATGVLTVYTYWDHNIKTTIYNEVFIKNYALALTKITLGEIRSKYSGIALPGGGSLNGETLKNEGISERDHWLEELRNWESEPYGFFIG